MNNRLFLRSMGQASRCLAAIDRETVLYLQSLRIVGHDFVRVLEVDVHQAIARANTALAGAFDRDSTHHFAAIGINRGDVMRSMVVSEDPPAGPRTRGMRQTMKGCLWGQRRANSQTCLRISL